MRGRVDQKNVEVRKVDAILWYYSKYVVIIIFEIK